MTDLFQWPTYSRTSQAISPEAILPQKANALAVVSSASPRTAAKARKTDAPRGMALASQVVAAAAQGDKRLTVPMYATAITVNLANSIVLLAQLNKHDLQLSMLTVTTLSDVDLAMSRFLLLWASMATFDSDCSLNI